MLTKNEFIVLSNIATSVCPLTQRMLKDLTGLSLGTVNKTVLNLERSNYIKDGQVTETGMQILQNYKVKRAVFLAAGFGSRLVPITLNTPKPMIRVNGKRIIDGLIDACLNVGIDEIYVVRGYLSSEFNQLLSKYPMIKFIENTIYNESNNISSAMAARQYLSNAYILESDLVINNPSVITPYQYCSNFLGFKTDRTDDWCFKTKNGKIISQEIGGVDCYQEYGISYWNDSDGKQLKIDLEQAFSQPGGKELFWDRVPFEKFSKHYSVSIRECKINDLTEIDTFNELKIIDKSYDI